MAVGLEIKIIPNIRFSLICHCISNWLLRPFSDRVRRASAAETIHWSSIPSLIKPKIVSTVSLVIASVSIQFMVPVCTLVLDLVRSKVFLFLVVYHTLFF